MPKPKSLYRLRQLKTAFCRIRHERDLARLFRIEPFRLQLIAHPTMGCFHVDTYQKPTLAFDLIEPFRPWVDQFVTEQIYTGKLTPECFDRKKQGVFLNKVGKSQLIPAYHHYMNCKCLFQEKLHRRKSHIYRLCGQLAKIIDQQKLDL